MECKFEVTGPLREVINVDGRPEQFNLYRYDFPNDIAEMIRQEQIPYRIIQALDRDGALNDTYYVLEKGDAKASGNPLVRIHSACFHGDTLRHMICDCGEQYETALEEISREETGLLIYCESQDGRGINKKLHFRSYMDQQDYGWDTFESFRKRGLDEDPRDYSDVIKILQSYGLDNIRLLTNNPDKIKPLESGGIKVERISIWTEETRVNRRQIEAKLERGHLR